jgi:hypothetical protein
MFSFLSVSLNGKLASLHVTNYHYKAYSENMLNYRVDGSRMRLVLSFLFLASVTPDGSHAADKANKGYATRLNYLSESRTIESYGRLHADLFN